MKKVAIVYDRVNKWGGAERVLLALHEIYPRAPLYTSVYDPAKAPWAKAFPKVYTSFLQRIPILRSNHEFLALLMPLAFSSFDFSKYDLVISITSEFAKNIKTEGKTKHICYCLTSTRYLWSGYDQYFKGPAFKVVSWPIVSFLRWLDKKASRRPDFMVAISTEVQKRIKKYYGRDSVIIFPPVDVVNRQSSIINYQSKNYYLLVSRLDYGYKKVDLAIKAFNKLNYPLVIVGTGREESKLKKIAGKNIIFAGRVGEERLNEYYKSAKALIMPQEEDFGIVAVEAQARGVPVIAFKKGGALDTVIPDKTGIFFDKQTPTSLEKTIRQFNDLNHWDKKNNICVTNARRFSKKVFQKELLDLTKKVLH